MKARKQSPWSWIPTLYIAEGLPFVIVTVVALVMYKRLGLSNAEVAFLTSLIALPWVFKPLWTPWVEAVGTKRNWSLCLQLLMSLCLLAVGYAIGHRLSVGWSLAALTALAFCSATHSVAASSCYTIHTSNQSTKTTAHLRRGFFHLSGLAGSGLMIMLAGGLETYQRHIHHSWSIIFYILAALFAALFLYHLFLLPRSANDRPIRRQLDYRRRWNHLCESITDFFLRPHALAMLLFLVFFRLPEALVLKVIPLFLLDSPTKGGLGLSTQEVGFASGTVGVIALAVGGLLGAKAIARWGFRACFWPLVALATLPKAFYLLLCCSPIQNFAAVNLCIFTEQLGCGLGFAAFTYIIVRSARNGRKTSHQALYSAIVALSLHVPGFVAGWLQESVGYRSFFVIVLGCSLLSIAVAACVRSTDECGKK